MRKSKIFQLTVCVLMSSSSLAYAMDGIETYEDHTKKGMRLIGQPETTLESLKELNIPFSPSVGPKDKEKLDSPHSIKDKMSPVKFQGGSLACATFGAVACLEAHQKLRLSEGQVARLAAVKYVKGGCLLEARGGMMLSTTMAYVRNVGAIEAQYWEFDDKNICCKQLPPKFDTLPKVKFDQVYTLYLRKGATILSKISKTLGDSLKEAPDFAVSYPKDPDLDQMKQILLQGSPIAIDIPVFWEVRNGKYEMICGWDDGRSGISMPTATELRHWAERESLNPSESYHVVTLTGYNNETQRFEFKNSWGTTRWGDKGGKGGYSTLPYDYVTKLSRTAMYGVKKPTSKL